MEFRWVTKRLLLALVCIETLGSSGPTVSNASASPSSGGFIRRVGTHLVDEEGKAFLVHGCNFYWLMYQAAHPSSRPMVDEVIRDARSLGLNVGRTWAFNDGTHRALQLSPGLYDEQVFQALDYSIAVAGSHGLRLVLSLVNNYAAYGGRPKYVEWARQAGYHDLDSVDSFYTHPITRFWYKNHVQEVLTRVNTYTGLMYKDDPAILSWELMNEPRCDSDPSGDTVMKWVTEMGAWVKSIDGKHLLQIGLEGFYGASSPDRVWANPDQRHFTGTDYIRMNQIPSIDFATVHSYPDLWLPRASERERVDFLERWTRVHMEDARDYLNKPVVFAEFGKCDSGEGYEPSQRRDLLWAVYDAVFSSAMAGGAGAGAMLWQLLPRGMMESWTDCFGLQLGDQPLARIISWQSHRMSQASQRLTSRLVPRTYQP